MSGAGSTLQQLTPEVVAAAELVASFFVPPGTAILAGKTAEELGNIIIGASGTVPALADAWNAAKNAIEGGTPPTAGQLQADFLKASAANDALAAADEAVEQGKPVT